MTTHGPDLEAMACQELVEVITDYIEGTLPPDDVRRLEAHLAVCDVCREYVEQMRRTMRMVGRLAAGEVDPAIRTRLVGAFRAWRDAAG